MRGSAVLISMPWALIEFPSISLGILNGVLRRAGIEPVIRSLNLSFLEFLVQATAADDEPITARDYHEIADASPLSGLGDWAFAVPPFREVSPEDESRYLDLLTGARRPPDALLLEKVRRIRRHVPAFIEQCVAEVLCHAPALVGFTTTFNQNVPALLLARCLKERAPHIITVFGGANCDGPMGQALFDSFSWVDVVVQGEAEGVVVELVREALDGTPVTPRPGLLVRGQVAPDQGDRSPRVKMDDVPTPDYDFFFTELDASPLRQEILPVVQLPVETARGCWWGEKSHCTFCGLNGSTMAFRSKSVQRALSDFLSLAARYRCLRFIAVDNIIDMEYLRSLLPLLQKRGLDLQIFYETKSNLSREQLRAMRDVGILRIQPGIESLSTSILKLMRKGVKGWQNVRLLKWCAQYGIHAAWNLIYGFPGEDPKEYARMSALLPALTHLEPPDLVRLQLQRFSPYHERPEKFGVRLLTPWF